jgi:hypothetical protein
VKTIIRSAPGLPTEYMLVRRDHLTHLYRSLAHARIAYTRLHRDYVRNAIELHALQAEKQERILRYPTRG